MSSVEHLPARTAARTRRFVPDPWLIPAALLGIIPLLSLLRPGIANTSDGMVHILRTVQVVELMKSGTFYPQWAPDFYFGYGYPFFLFYAPGAHILAALFALLGLGASGGVVAVQVLAVLLYGIGGYLAARALFEGLAPPHSVSAAALAAAALFVFAPLRLRELFLQGNLSQLLAARACCPWRCGPWSRLPGKVRGGGPLSQAFFSPPCSTRTIRPPSSHIPCCWRSGWPLRCLTARGSNRDPGGCAVARAIAAAFALGLALSAPFWLPWLLESGYGSLGRMESGMFNAALNLVPPDELFSPSLVLDASSINPPRPNTLGLLQAVLAVLGRRGRRLHVVARPFAAGARPAARPADDGRAARCWLSC